MRTIFVDTSFWVAIINPQDQLHALALSVRRRLGRVRLVTTESVLLEVLNYFSEHGVHARHRAAQVVRKILADASVETVVQTTAAWLAGLDLYEARLDKGYSLTDCLSMNVLRERQLNEVLSHDRHFVQENFTILL